MKIQKPTKPEKKLVCGRVELPTSSKCPGMLIACEKYVICVAILQIMKEAGAKKETTGRMKGKNKINNE